MINRVTNLIQLCIKARKVAKGDQLLSSIQKNKAKLIVISDSCGKNTLKKIQDKCAYYHVPYIIVESDILGNVSYSKLSAIAILDDGFAKAILNKVKG